MILILTDETDEHADRMERELRARGEPYVRFDPAAFPSEAAVDLRFDPAGLVARRLRIRDQVVDLDAVTAVWFRRPGRPAVPPQFAGSLVGEVIAEECATAISDVWETIEAFAVPAARPVVHRAQYKARQLQLAGSLGFELPPTLVTTDPSAFLEFFSAQGGRVVTKRIGLAELQPSADGELICRYTDGVRHRDLVHVDSLRHCPVITQAYVPKARELRVTVVGGSLFAASIDSQETNHARHDWRRYDNARTVMEPYDLPAEVGGRCRSLVAALGLHYGALDLVLTPDGRHVFLEVNPSGQYLWIEDATGLPITAAVADLLSGVRTELKEAS